MSIRQRGIGVRLLVITSLVTGSALAGCTDPPAVAPPSKTPTSEATPTGAESAAEHQAALDELDAGERQLAVAAGDCGSACEALHHVAHARARLCAQPKSPDCLDATQRDREASARVASTCAPCGPP